MEITTIKKTDFGMRAMLKRISVGSVSEASILQIGDACWRIRS